MKTLILAILLITATSGLFWILIRPGPWEPEQETYRRDIFLLIDQTPSNSKEEFAKLKNLSLRKIIQRLGPGDRLFCARIDTDFTEADDLVFEATGELPMLPQNYPNTEVDRWPERARLDLARRWELFEPIRANWTERITALELLPHTESSDYFAAIRYLGELVAARGNAEERWLIVLGDLKHEPQTDLEPLADDRATQRLFTGVKVRLVSPYGTNTDQEQEILEASWKKLFRS